MGLDGLLLVTEEKKRDFLIWVCLCVTSFVKTHRMSCIEAPNASGNSSLWIIKVVAMLSVQGLVRVGRPTRRKV